MDASRIQELIWDAILILRNANLMTSKEAASICLVRFTWTETRAMAKLKELQERYTAANQTALNL